MSGGKNGGRSETVSPFFQLARPAIRIGARDVKGGGAVWIGKFPLATYAAPKRTTDTVLLKS